MKETRLLTVEKQEQLSEVIQRLLGPDANFVLLAWQDENGGMISNTDQETSQSALQDALDTMKHERDFEVAVHFGEPQ